MLILVADIHLYENTDPVNALFRTGPQAIHVVLAGNLMPVDTMLVTPVLQQERRYDIYSIYVKTLITSMLFLEQVRG